MAERRRSYRAHFRVGAGLFAIRRDKGWLLLFSWIWIWIWAGIFIALTGHYPCKARPQGEYHQPFTHGGNVSQKPRLGVPDNESISGVDKRIPRFFAASGRLGGGSVAFAVVLFSVSIYEHVNDRNIPAYWLEGLGVLAFCFGALVAWNEEHKKLIAEMNKNQKPLLEGEIVEAYIGPAMTGEKLRSPSAVVLFVVRAWNAIQMPDIVLLRYGLKVTIETPDGLRTFKGQQVRGTINLITMNPQGSVRAINMQREVLRPQRYMHPARHAGDSLYPAYQQRQKPSLSLK